MQLGFSGFIIALIMSELGQENQNIELPGDQVPENDQEMQKPGSARFLLDLLETLLLAAVIFIGINAISARIRVDGTSMLPTLEDGEYILVNKMVTRFGSLEHGDIVVFNYPRGGQDFIKRVIGLPGDHIRVFRGGLFINGEEIDEPYTAAPANYNGSWDIPEGHVFVLGDNRNNSSDSHQWGPVPIEDVVGEAIFIYWPPDDWGAITQPELDVLAYLGKNEK